MNGDPSASDEADQPGRAAPWMGFLAALQFLTILPPVVRRPFSTRELGASVGWFPFVGLLLGLALVLLDALLGLVLPIMVRSATLLAFWVLLTGALHLDGFVDACDGLFGGWTPEKRLEILHDERVGAYALAGGVLLLLVKFSGLSSLSLRWEALLLAPVLGRWSMTLSLVAYPYARSDGLGSLMKEEAGWREVVMASTVAVATAWCVGRWTGLALLGVALLATWAAARFAVKRIHGLTGDIYGAINEIVEGIVLLSWVVIQNLAIG